MLAFMGCVFVLIGVTGENGKDVGLIFVIAGAVMLAIDRLADAIESRRP